jgi:predicted nucleotidyltransferase
MLTVRQVNTPPHSDLARDKLPPLTAPQRFTQALDELIELIKPDRSILAAVLCGSLSHDTVWDKSDIDLILVTVDDNKIDSAGVVLYSHGVNVHAIRMPRAEFRKTVEGSARNGFFHSLLAKGRLLYTHDPTVADLCARLAQIGERDTQLQLFSAGTHATGPLYKARKWFLTRGDLDYTALWILYTATPLARIEVVSARLLADREVIPQALKLNPAFFKLIYTDLLNTKKTRKSVQTALEAVEGYLAERAPTLFAPLIKYLEEIGEARSCTELENHFKRNFDVGGVTSACEYLADQGLIAKVSTPLQLTRRSNVIVQEMAFVALGERDGY